MTLDSVIDKEFTPVDKDMELSQMVHAMSKSHSDVLPVLDPAGNILGEVDLAKIRHIVFRTELYHRFRVSQLMEPVKATVRLGDPMEDVMAAFEKNEVQHLPVLDKDGHLFGYVFKSHLYSQYRQMVADLSNE